MSSQKQVAKWGFGMAPISSRMRRRYDAGVHTVSDLMYGLPVDVETVPEALSDLKGMFNRYVRQDQWDYAMVGEELGNPPVKQARLIADELLVLRRALMRGDGEIAEASKVVLERNGIIQYLENYQALGRRQGGCHGEGWIYVLSRREEPNILKVGRTNRSVSIRVKEINSAPGVLFPFGARFVYRVNDAVEAERLVHQALNAYRVRRDREFFDITPHDADSIIQSCIREHGLRQRTKGTVLWFDASQFYGFVTTDGQGDVFIHGSEVRREQRSMMRPGMAVEFLMNKNRRGSFATSVTVVGCDATV